MGWVFLNSFQIIFTPLWSLCRCSLCSYLVEIRLKTEVLLYSMIRVNRKISAQVSNCTCNERSISKGELTVHRKSKTPIHRSFTLSSTSMGISSMILLIYVEFQKEKMWLFDRHYHAKEAFYLHLHFILRLKTTNKEHSSLSFKNWKDETLKCCGRYANLNK